MIHSWKWALHFYCFFYIWYYICFLFLTFNLWFYFTCDFLLNCTGLFIYFFKSLFRWCIDFRALLLGLFLLGYILMILKIVIWGLFMTEKKMGASKAYRCGCWCWWFEGRMVPVVDPLVQLPPPPPAPCCKPMPPPIVLTPLLTLRLWLLLWWWLYREEAEDTEEGLLAE